MKKIGTVFARALEGASQNGGDEPIVVEAFVREVERQRTAFGPAVNIQTAFVHQRPYALFRRPAQLCGASRCELGDVLLVFKRVAVSGSSSSVEMARLFLENGANFCLPCMADSKVPIAIVSALHGGNLAMVQLQNASRAVGEKDLLLRYRESLSYLAPGKRQAADVDYGACFAGSRATTCRNLAALLAEELAIPRSPTRGLIAIHRITWSCWSPLTPFITKRLPSGTLTDGINFSPATLR